MAYDNNDNDGRFPDESRVEVRYPRTGQEEHGDRAAWPWLPGSIVEQCGPDEWLVCVEDRDVAVLHDGRPPRRAPRPGTSAAACRQAGDCGAGCGRPCDRHGPHVISTCRPRWPQSDPEVPFQP